MTVLLVLAAKMAVFGAALALRGGDVCVSNMGETKRS